MNKELLILVLAHNGLSAAAALLGAVAQELEQQATRIENDLPTAQHLHALAANKAHLSRVLAAADAGIADYLAHN